MDIESSAEYRTRRELTISLDCSLNKPHLFMEVLKQLPADTRIEDFDIREQCITNGKRWLVLVLSSAASSWFKKDNQPIRFTTKTQVTVE